MRRPKRISTALEKGRGTGQMEVMKGSSHIPLILFLLGQFTGPTGGSLVANSVT